MAADRPGISRFWRSLSSSRSTRPIAAPSSRSVASSTGMADTLGSLLARESEKGVLSICGVVQSYNGGFYFVNTRFYFVAHRIEKIELRWWDVSIRSPGPDGLRHRPAAPAYPRRLHAAPLSPARAGAAQQSSGRASQELQVPPQGRRALRHPAPNRL